MKPAPKDAPSPDPKQIDAFMRQLTRATVSLRAIARGAQRVERQLEQAYQTHKALYRHDE